MQASFTADDLQAATRLTACHKTQFTADVVQRVTGAIAQVWNGKIPFIPAFSSVTMADRFGGSE